MVFSTFAGMDVRGSTQRDEFDRYANDALVDQFPSSGMYRGWRLTHSGWGETNEKMLVDVLSDTAAVLFEHVSEERIRDIKVAVFSWELLPPNPNYGGRSYTSGDVFNVYLKSYGNDWRRYISVYAHELCHVLDANSRTPTNYRWFEETLCQVASLHVLRAVADRWSVSNSAYKREYAPRLREYYDFLLYQRKNTLPDGHSLATWFSTQGHGLASKWEDYSKNDVIARRLFPYFVAYPGAWDALSWLREAGDARDLPEYLARWHDVSPRPHKRFIRELASEFGFVFRPATGQRVNNQFVDN